MPMIYTQPLLNVLIIELFQAWNTYHYVTDYS